MFYLAYIPKRFNKIGRIQLELLNKLNVLSVHNILVKSFNCAAHFILRVHYTSKPFNIKAGRKNRDGYTIEPVKTNAHE